MAITLVSSGQNGQTSKKSKELRCFCTGCMLEYSLWNHTCTCLKLCTSQFVRQEAGALQNLLTCLFPSHCSILRSQISSQIRSSQSPCICKAYAYATLPCPWQYASDKGRSQGTNLGTNRENPSQGTASLPKMGRINLLSRAMGAGWMYVSTPKRIEPRTIFASYVNGSEFTSKNQIQLWTQIRESGMKNTQSMNPIYPI
jgi:hypothetical protein